ncbi:DNA-binding transcriptional regulator, FadR family [Micromonospora rhizosphaerae]|uniref:DNA-binding transcriptional regulator, FadR family n=1 Tax=Micromonospora rhizosphaerae TaxID=568872 RepID=A0A1C6RSV5_9ACTN|nr:FadR/GntR family transcriptional regulator [Micromonospora rhizosphaerae]SCL20296.1 DNA-binding transcriptional regulator, FadR family [Micromonospora rhizosphaerae]
MSNYPDRGLHGHVVREVGRRIVAGEFPPGTTIEVDRLEREYDVSLTVVREALRVLAAKGLVDARPKRGTFVRPRTDWSLLDPDLLRWQFEGADNDAFLANLAEVRLIVEPQGARLAAARRTDADLDALEAALASVTAEPTTEVIVDADLAFHRALLAATHNELLVRMEHIIEIGLRTRDLIVHAEGHRDDFLPPHREVLDAVRAADGDRAEQAMRALLEQAARDERELGS